MALFFWGASDYFAGRSGKSSDEYLTNFVVQSISTLLLVPIVLWYGFSIELDTSLFVVFVIAVLFTIAYVSFVQALTIGPYGIAVPLANSYALVTLIIGLLFFNFQIGMLQIAVLTLIIAGVILLAVDKTTFSLRNFHGSTVYFSAITLLCWGIAFALVDVVAVRFAWYELLFLIGIFMSTLGFLYYVLMRRKLPVLSDMRYTRMKYAWQAGVLLFFGAAAFFIAVETTQSVVVPAVIASASPLVTSFLAYFHDNERLNIFKRTGAIIVVVGIMLLNIL